MNDFLKKSQKSVMLIKVFEFYSIVFVLSYFHDLLTFHSDLTTMVEKCQQKYALKMLSVSRGLNFSRTKALNSKSYKIKNAGKKSWRFLFNKVDP